MVTPRLGEAGDATGTEHAAELAHHAGGIRDVMKRVEAEDAIDALVRQVDAASIEDEKARRRGVADRGKPREELRAELQRRW